MKKLLSILMISIPVMGYNLTSTFKIGGSIAYNSYEWQKMYNNAPNLWKHTQEIGITLESGTKYYNIHFPFDPEIQLSIGTDINYNLNYINYNDLGINIGVYKELESQLKNLQDTPKLNIDIKTLENSTNIPNVTESRDILDNRNILSSFGSNIFIKAQMSGVFSENGLRYLVSIKTGVNIGIAPEFDLYRILKNKLIENTTYDNISDDKKIEIKKDITKQLDDIYNNNFYVEKVNYFIQVSAGIKYKKILFELYSGYNTSMVGFRISYEE